MPHHGVGTATDELLAFQNNYLATPIGSEGLPGQYQQLLNRGKEKKVAITACTLAPHASAGVRKMLTILNAMMRDQQPFRVSLFFFPTE